jgi:hypothetical protein
MYLARLALDALPEVMIVVAMTLAIRESDLLEGVGKK